VPAPAPPLPPPASSTDAFAARFIARTLAKDEWTHAAHITVGTWHVYHHGGDEALPLLRARIRALNEALGGLNTATGGYHETITAAYVTLLAGFLERFAGDLPLGPALARVKASPLLDREVLLRFYSRERLCSMEARAGWVEPDLQPLDIARLYGGEFAATLFRHQGTGGWVFAPVPDGCAPPGTHGWGRIPVMATVDGHTWPTSVWRGTDGRTLLAVPKRVRSHKDDGDTVQVRLSFEER